MHNRIACSILPIKIVQVQLLQLRKQILRVTLALSECRRKAQRGENSNQR
jgi:hypothetical protein